MPDFERTEEEAADRLDGLDDQARLLGLDPATPEPPPERCERHGLYAFNLWSGCPVCEREDELAFEASKQYRPAVHIVRRHPDGT